MKKFKTYFYGLYVLYLTFSLLIAVFYEDLVLHWDWDPIQTWTGLIRLVLQVGGVGVVLLVVEIIVENIHLSAKTTKINSLESEIQSLKAKLYDKSQEESESPATEPVQNEVVEEKKMDEPEA